jgi:predicted cupin superfamily sugar epimerase
MSNESASYWIKHLNLQPHPEGGFYREIFRSGQEIHRPSSSEIKQACTSIYYLLEGTDYSGFHRLASDEIWYFHKGKPLHIHVINEQGTHAAFELSDTASGCLSVAIAAGLWFAAEIPSGCGFALASCVVAPGFEFSEFEMAKKEELIALYPQYQSLLAKFCR